jgi:membrane protease YdiL (CAAX protease family)
MGNKVSRAAVVNWTICIEAFLLLVATGWSHFAGIPLQPALVFHYKAALIGLGAGCLMALAGYLLFLMSRSLAAFGQLRELIESYLIPMLAELKPFDLVIMAVVSGFCEEIFFRGVGQAQLGVVITSICFGLFHDPTFRHPSYAVVAFLYGLILGGLYMYTGNLWAPIIAHVVHNLISLYMLRYKIKPPASPVKG